MGKRERARSNATDSGKTQRSTPTGKGHDNTRRLEGNSGEDSDDGDDDEDENEEIAFGQVCLFCESGCIATKHCFAFQVSYFH